MPNTLTTETTHKQSKAEQHYLIRLEQPISAERRSTVAIALASDLRTAPDKIKKLLTKGGTISRGMPHSKAQQLYTIFQRYHVPVVMERANKVEKDTAPKPPLANPTSPANKAKHNQAAEPSPQSSNTLPQPQSPAPTPIAQASLQPARTYSETQTETASNSHSAQAVTPATAAPPIIGRGGRAGQGGTSASYGNNHSVDLNRLPSQAEILHKPETKPETKPEQEVAANDFSQGYNTSHHDTKPEDTPAASSPSTERQTGRSHEYRAASHEYSEYSEEEQKEIIPADTSFGQLMRLAWQQTTASGIKRFWIPVLLVISFICGIFFFQVASSRLGGFYIEAPRTLEHASLQSSLQPQYNAPSQQITYEYRQAFYPLYLGVLSLRQMFRMMGSMFNNLLAPTFIPPSVLWFLLFGVALQLGWQRIALKRWLNVKGGFKNFIIFDSILGHYLLYQVMIIVFGSIISAFFSFVLLPLVITPFASQVGDSATSIIALFILGVIFYVGIAFFLAHLQLTFFYNAQHVIYKRMPAWQAFSYNLPKKRDPKAQGKLTRLFWLLFFLFLAASFISNIALTLPNFLAVVVSLALIAAAFWIYPWIYLMLAGIYLQTYTNTATPETPLGSARAQNLSAQGGHIPLAKYQDFNRIPSEEELAQAKNAPKSAGQSLTSAAYQDPKRIPSQDEIAGDEIADEIAQNYSAPYYNSSTRKPQWLNQDISFIELFTLALKSTQGIKQYYWPISHMLILILLYDLYDNVTILSTILILLGIGFTQLGWQRIALKKLLRKYYSEKDFLPLKEGKSYKDLSLEEAEPYIHFVSMYVFVFILGVIFNLSSPFTRPIIFCLLALFLPYITYDMVYRRNNLNFIQAIQQGITHASTQWQHLLGAALLIVAIDFLFITLPNIVYFSPNIVFALILLLCLVWLLPTLYLFTAMLYLRHQAQENTDTPDEIVML